MKKLFFAALLIASACEARVDPSKLEMLSGEPNERRARCKPGTEAIITVDADRRPPALVVKLECVPTAKVEK